MPRRPNCTCTICGKPIYRRPAEIERSGGRVYCSQACFGKSCRKLAQCPVCGKEILARAYRKTCSRECANRGRTGIKYKQADRPSRDRVRDNRALRRRLIEARGPRCQRCGYADVNILVVHHIVRRSDGGRDDLENLELICPNRHAEAHFYGVKHNKRGRKSS